MRILHTTLILLLLAAAPVRAADVAVGAPAPDFAAVDSTGKLHRLSDYRGKFVVLEWTNHECPFVKKHYGSGNMQALQKFAARKGVVWLSVISSAPGKQGHVSGIEADALTAERGAAPVAVLLDPEGKVGRFYGARTTPHMFIVDPAGELVYMGGIDSIPSTDREDIERATPYVKAALTAALDGKPVPDPVTKPYGCSVKY